MAGESSGGIPVMENEMTLPCGCVVGTVEDAFVIVACPVGRECEWVQFVLTETALTEKPHTILEM